MMESVVIQLIIYILSLDITCTNSHLKLENVTEKWVIAQYGPAHRLGTLYSILFGLWETRIPSICAKRDLVLSVLNKKIIIKKKQKMFLWASFTQYPIVCTKLTIYKRIFSLSFDQISLFWIVFWRSVGWMMMDDWWMFENSREADLSKLSSWDSQLKLLIDITHWWPSNASLQQANQGHYLKKARTPKDTGKHSEGHYKLVCKLYRSQKSLSKFCFQNVYLWVYVCVHICVCMYVYIHLYVYKWFCVCMNMYTYAFVCICIYKHIMHYFASCI